MKDIKEEFINHIQSKELKELGFNKSCFGLFDSLGNIIIKEMPNQKECEEYFMGCLAPTYSQAFRWFIDNHNLLYYWEKPKLKEDYYWDFLIYNEITGEKIFVVRAKHNKEAESACLDKLIEIVKNKNNE